MDNILAIADEMTSSLENSELYKAYINAKRVIIEDVELYERMKEFKRHHIALQGRRINDIGVDFEEELRVSRMYFTLLQDKRAKAYFESEERLINTLGGVYEKLGKQCSELVTEF